MGRATSIGWLAACVIALGGCETEEIVFVDDGDPPAAPRGVDAFYHDRAVFVTWELAPRWDGESFRVYSRRTTDPDFFLIAEVTNCSGGLCSYTDTNIVADMTYEYFVAAVSPETGEETSSASSVRVFVPRPIPPPVPERVEVVALDDAAFVRWEANARDASDFAFYRVYLAGDGGDFLLGETDSEGFLDLLAVNGTTSRYVVTSVDRDGHESSASRVASGTPRPDFHGEWLWSHFDRPEHAGFRFEEDESVDPVVDGSSGRRHFRLEEDGTGWWLVPGPGAEVHVSAFETTSIKCGPGSDAGCVALEEAPTSGYTTDAIGLAAQLTFVMRVPGDDGLDRYGALRVELLGFDQDGDAIMIFDWAYQLQPGNPALAPVPMSSR